MSQEQVVREHATADSFWADCAELLMSSMALHQHIIHNTSVELLAGEERFMFTVHSAGTADVVAAVAIKATEGLPRASLAGDLTVEAAFEIIRAMDKKSPKFSASIFMTMGSASSRQAFADAYVGLYPLVTQAQGMSCVAMELRNPCLSTKGVPGAMRLVSCAGSPSSAGALTTDTVDCDDNMLLLLASWQAAFVKDALGDDTKPDDYRESVLAGLSAGSIYAWQVDDDIVSIARLGRRLLDTGVSLSSVYNPPHHRGRGYSKSLLTKMCSALQAQGKRVFLFADTKSQFGTVRLYESIGFSNDGPYGDIRFVPSKLDNSAEGIAN